MTTYIGTAKRRKIWQAILKHTIIFLVSIAITIVIICKLPIITNDTLLYVFAIFISIVSLFYNLDPTDLIEQLKELDRIEKYENEQCEKREQQLAEARAEYNRLILEGLKRQLEKWSKNNRTKTPELGNRAFFYIIGKLYYRVKINLI